ncbi:hypothetical protein Tco_1323849, partial [Tanacetum coccineum]
ANEIANAYKDPEENKLIQKTGDIGSFIKWYCKRIGKLNLNKADLEGPAFKIDLVNPEGNRVVPDVSKPLLLACLPADKDKRHVLLISKLKAAYYQDFGIEELVPSLWIKSERKYNISAAYGISHWWFKRKEFYITRHSVPSDRHAVRSHIKILSVVIIKTFSRYGYTFLREIVLHRADYKEYKISEADFTHPNDFEDIDRNNQKMMMRESKVHKFSDGTLTRILEQLDHMVKDYMLFKFNPSMEHRIWSKYDKRRSKEFIEVIERRFKIRRIFRNLESFVSGRLKDVDYRLIQRTE